MESALEKSSNNNKLVIQALKRFKTINQGESIIVVKRITRKRPPRVLRGEVIFKNDRMVTVKIKHRKESFTLADVIDKTVILQKEKESINHDNWSD